MVDTDLCKCKKNIMEKEKLELRMFGFVPYQLMGIQSGIQFGHAVVDYGRMVSGIPGLEDQYNDWADNHKTFIIYNGGTTNDNPTKLGTMQMYRDMLKENKVVFSEFREEDLGDQLLGVCFIADERVFNEVKYPNYEKYLKKTLPPSEVKDKIDFDKMDYYKSLVENTPKRFNTSPLSDTDVEDMAIAVAIYPLYKEWVKFMGGEKNLFLRKFNKNFKLAN